MEEYLYERENKRRWVRWKKVLCLAIYILIMSGIVVGGFYLYPRLLPRFVGKDDVCLTENCLKASVHITSSMDTSEDPCYDFYQFTCGNFINKAYENNSPSQYHIQKLNIEHKLNHIIFEPITGVETKLYLLQKKFYRSCVNVTAIDHEGLGHFEEIIDDIGGWPVLERSKWKEEDFDLSEVILKCMDMGLPFQWFFDVMGGDNWIGLNPPRTTKLFDAHYKESVYLDLMTETAVNFGAFKTIARRQMKKVLRFEKKIEEIVADHSESNFLPLSTLSTITPIPSWLYVFIDKITENSTLGQEEILLDAAYVRKLNLLVAGTSKRDQANFIIWKVVQEFGPYLADPIRNYFLKFSYQVSSKKQVNTRLNFCVQEAVKRFPFVAEVEFIRRYVDGDKVEAIKDIILNIKERFINRLNAAEWIDDVTKEMGVDKVSSIVEVIGQPTTDPTEALQILGHVEFTTDNAIDMLRKINKNTLLPNSTDTDFLSNFIYSVTLSVNAVYMEKFNVIFLPAGIVQEISYALNRPNYVNYGTLGSIIGHEIAHAFTKIPMQIGNEEKMVEKLLNNTTFEQEYDMYSLTTGEIWQNDSLKILNSKKQCVINNMDTFKHSVTDEMLLNENIADLIGVDIAYEAYVSWSEQYEKEQVLPNLPFTPRQLFWISFGAMNCYRHIDSVPWSIGGGTHASLRYRVFNTLKNSENFARDFHCLEASVMNPIEKCHIF